MRSKYGTLALALLAALTVGCSKSDDADAEAENHNTKSKTIATVSTSAESTDADEEVEFVTPFDESVDIFSPPKTRVAPDPREAEVEVAEPDPDISEVPKLRLLGFVTVNGLKAMISIDGELISVASGDKVGDLEIVSVEVPTLTLRFREKDLKLNLCEHRPTRARTVRPAPGNAVAASRPTRPVGPELPTLPGFGPTNAPMGKDATLPDVPMIPGRTDPAAEIPGLPGATNEADATLPAVDGRAF